MNLLFKKWKLHRPTLLPYIFNFSLKMKYVWTYMQRWICKFCIVKAAWRELIHSFNIAFKCLQVVLQEFCVCKDSREKTQLCTLLQFLVPDIFTRTLYLHKKCFYHGYIFMASHEKKKKIARYVPTWHERLYCNAMRQVSVYAKCAYSIIRNIGKYIILFILTYASLHGRTYKIELYKKFRFIF